MTTPIRADIAEKENAPSPAVKPSPKPADIARGDDDKFVGLDGKVKHRKVVKADGTTVDASTGHAAAPRGGEQEPMNDYERQREVRDDHDTRHARYAHHTRRTHASYLLSSNLSSSSLIHPPADIPGTHPPQQRTAPRSKGPRHRQGPRTLRGRRRIQRQRRQTN